MRTSNQVSQNIGHPRAANARSPNVSSCKSIAVLNERIHAGRWTVPRLALASVSGMLCPLSSVLQLNLSSMQPKACDRDPVRSSNSRLRSPKKESCSAASSLTFFLACKTSVPSAWEIVLSRCSGLNQFLCTTSVGRPGSDTEVSLPRAQLVLSSCSARAQLVLSSVHSCRC